MANGQKREQPTLDEWLEGSEDEGARYAFVIDQDTKSLAVIDTTLRVLYDQQIKVLEQLCIVNERLDKLRPPDIVE